jgi:glycosyltransferase involved in cell wall biosynthesis
MLAPALVGNVLHISEADAAGGAARSAFRLHRGLRELGWRSRMLVGQRRTTDPDVRLLKRNLAWRAADRACATVTDRLDLQYVLYPSSFGVALDPWFRAAEVVQLYNVHGSYFSHTALPFLSRRRPLVWRLSDMWALTGHVAYSYECERWRTGCGACPHLHEYPRLGRDTTALLFRWKDAVYRRSRISVVAPSRWLERTARESPLLGRFPVRRIPNGIDLETFRPAPRDEARAALGLDRDRPTVLWSALDLTDRRKGGREAIAAVERLAARDVQLVVAGDGDAPAGARSLGLLDDERLALAYAAADVFLLPALAENLPNAALESIACGTPVAAFDVGGMSDAVREGTSGRLVPEGDVAALAAGVDELLGVDLRDRCRALAEGEFGAEREARAFADLYAELIA